MCCQAELIDLTLFVFQWAIAFNSPVSVIFGVGGRGGGRWLGLESGDLTKEVGPC